MSISRGGDYREQKPTSIGEPDKVQSWPFKEPDKTSAWTDADRAPAKDAPVRLVDHEFEKKERAKKAIRDAMSPPDALGLPPGLEAARQKYGIPDGVFKAIAGFDRVLIYPIDPFDGDDKIAGTGLYRPNLTMKKDLQEGYRGVLISAGLTAADRLMGHGYMPGDVVVTNKNVPFARRCQQIPEVGDIFVLVMRDGDIAANESLAERIREGKAKIVDIGTDEEWCHQVAYLDEDGEWTVRKKKSVYVNDSF